MHNSTLQLGFREQARPSRYVYDATLFEQGGRYAAALRTLFGNRAYKVLQADERRLALRLVHQCEEARRWHNLYTDLPRARTEYYREMASSLLEAAKLVDELRRVDGEHAYFFRNCLKGAIEPLLPPPQALDVQVPDQNHDEGGPVYRAEPAVKTHIEHSLAWNISLFQSDKFLENFSSELRKWGERRAEFSQLGPLRLEPPLTFKAAAKLHVHIAGLSAWLHYSLREWSAGRGVRPFWPGTEMPKDGRPQWSNVADFVNAAFPEDVPQTADSLRQQWHVLTRKHDVRLDPWPTGVVREPQIV